MFNKNAFSGNNNIQYKMTHYYKDLDTLLVKQCSLKQNKNTLKCLLKRDYSIRQLLFLSPKNFI